MTRWEYQTVKLKAKGWLGVKVDEAEVNTVLNNAGREGWELAAAPPLMSNGFTGGVLLMFKRPGH